MKIRTLLLCSALAAGGACHRDDANHRAGEAAQNVNDKAKDVRGNAQDETHANSDLARATSDFAVRRDQAVAGYRAELKIYQSTLPVAQSFLADPTLAMNDRNNANDKIQMFDRECNLAEQSIDALSTSTAAQWDQASSTAADQMQKVRDTHDDAFGALSAERKLTTPTTTDKVPVTETPATGTKVVPVPKLQEQTVHGDKTVPVPKLKEQAVPVNPRK